MYNKPMPPTLRQLRVFLCHASQDKFIVRELQQRFADEGWIDPWLDEKKLHPGEEWRMSIEEAVERSDLVVICLSDNSVNKEGFIQKELRYAREIALEKPEGTIFLIPLRLDDCEVPRGLRFFQWTDFFGEKKEQNYNELLESFSIRRLQVIRREEEMARKEAEELEKREKEEQERREEVVRIKLEKEELARKQAEEKAREEAEERGREIELEKAKKEAFENVVREAKEKARLEAEIKVQKEIEDTAHQKELAPNLPTKLPITNSVPILLLAAVFLLIVGLFLGFGLVGMGQLGIGPFAKLATSTISPTQPATSLPLQPTIVFTNSPLSPTKLATNTPQKIFTPTSIIRATFSNIKIIEDTPGELKFSTDYYYDGKFGDVTISAGCFKNGEQVNCVVTNIEPSNLWILNKESSGTCIITLGLYGPDMLTTDQIFVAFYAADGSTYPNFQFLDYIKKWSVVLPTPTRVK